jgi:hypothetical protein
MPWGFVAGYYDFDTGLNSADMLKEESKFKYAASSLNNFQLDGKEMYHQFTYMVPIESENSAEQIAGRIWFLGTGKANCMGMGGFDCIRRD